MDFTIVFIPGLVSDRRAWSDVEQKMIDQGFGTGIADLYQADSITGMAQAVLDQFPGQLLPVGHSMGGRVAMELVRLAPERLVGAVFVATGAHPLAEGELANRERVIELANTSGMKALCDRWLPPMLRPDIRETEPELYKRLEQMVIEAGAAVHERQIRALIARPDARPVLASLKLPALFVAGEHDGWSDPQQHRQMAALVTDASTEVAEVVGAGHFLQVEEPDRFSEILCNWLERQKLV